MGNCSTSKENPNVRVRDLCSKSHIQWSRAPGRHDNDVVDVKRLRRRPTRNAAIESQLHRVAPEPRRPSETQAAACAAQDVVEPEALRGVVVLRRLEVHPNTT